MKRGHILIDREIESMLGTALLVGDGAPAIRREQIQPASLDLRLASRAYRMRAGFLASGRSIEDRIEHLAEAHLEMDASGLVFEKGQVYLVELEERLALPEDLRGRFNPRSSTGRCDVFTRVLCPGHPRFDETPAGYQGKLWLEISPLSFPVRLRPGDRLAQVRIQRGRPALTTGELVELYDSTPLVFRDDAPLPSADVRFDDDGGLLLSVGLQGREPAGWRARAQTPALDFSHERGHDVEQFWEPVETSAGTAILEPGAFYVFASRERLRVPPTHAAEMLPVDVGIGELRNNYAGFFDSGFGWPTETDSQAGTAAVLEVRVRDVPFLIEDGQVFFRLQYFHTSEPPQNLYGEGRSGASYRRQDLALARVFRDPLS